MADGKTVPQVVRCGGALGCGQTLDLGAVEELRGTRAIEHLRHDPHHSETAFTRLVTGCVFSPA